MLSRHAHSSIHEGKTVLAELKRTELSVRQERAVLVGVILPGSTADPREPLGELGSLAKTAGGIWFAIGVMYVAIKTRGFRAAPVIIDFSES